MVDARLVVAEARGKHSAGAGDLADAVAVKIRHPDVAELIDRERIRAIATGNLEELRAVRGDAGDDGIVLVSNPSVMAAVDSDRKREGEGIGGISRCAGERCACARKKGDVRVAEVDDPRIG